MSSAASQSVVRWLSIIAEPEEAIAANLKRAERLVARVKQGCGDTRL